MRRDPRTLLGWAVTVVLAAIVIVGFLAGDPGEEDRVARLGASIKCPVCQGEAIADSPSPTAQAMMVILEEKVAAGETNQQIYAYFKTRFGDGIVLDPPFAGKTLLVWILPMVAVAGGMWMILSRRPTRSTTPAGTP